MKIFLAEGRLGNQIFQYVFLKTVQKNNETIIVSGFEDLKEVFEVNNFININKKNRWIRAFLFKICKPILTFLGDKKIISSISVNHEKILGNYSREITEFDTEIGRIKDIMFIKLGFFQSEKFFDKEVASKLRIKNIYLDKAAKILNTIPKHNHKIFIHIRRGDYKEYTVCGKSTLLPLSYYREQIEWFLENRKDCFFIFLSDDPEFVKDKFGYIEDKLISTKNHFGTDLTIMTLCDSAILSPSSFGWWGSYLMKERDTVFAPKYWLGFNSGMNFASNISSCPSFTTEIEIGKN